MRKIAYVMIYIYEQLLLDFSRHKSECTNMVQ